MELIPYLVIELRKGLKIFKQRNDMSRLTFGKVTSALICRRSEGNESSQEAKITMKTRGPLLPLHHGWPLLCDRDILLSLYIRISSSTQSEVAASLTSPFLHHSCHYLMFFLMIFSFLLQEHKLYTRRDFVYHCITNTGTVLSTLVVAQKYLLS